MKKIGFLLKTESFVLITNSSIFVLLILLVGCSGCNGASSDSLYHDSASDEEESYELPEIPHNIRNDKFSRAIFFTNKYGGSTTDLISPNFIMNSVTEDEAFIVTEGDLAYHTLPGEMSADALQERYNNIFDVERINVDQSEYQEPFYHKLSYKNSYIKVHHLKYMVSNNDQCRSIDNHNIVCAVIKDKEIELLAGIRVGMSKREFFYEKLGLKIPLSIDTLEARDTTGEIQQQFIFKDNKLEKVLITTYYAFADFQFY